MVRFYVFSFAVLLGSAAALATGADVDNLIHRTLKGAVDVIPDRPPSAPLSYDRVVVEKGQTFYRLAREHGMTVEAAAQLNHLKPPYTLSVGQELRFPSLKPVSTSQPHKKQPQVHRKMVHVQKGDTLYSLARSYHMPVEDVAKLNHLQPPYTLSVGQVLVLEDSSPQKPQNMTKDPEKPSPKAPKTPEKPPEAVSPVAQKVTVQKGDTLYSLSRTYSVSLQDLILTNHLQPPYALSVGRVLQLPLPAVHVVQKGETAYGLSRQYGLDLHDLVRLNHLQPPYALSVGQTLKLSAAVDADAPQAQTTRAPSKDKDVVSDSSKKPAATKPPRVVKKKPQKVKPDKVVPQPPVRTSTQFDWPIKGKILLKFGPVPKGLHNDGINIQAPKGAQVKAAEGALVAYAGNELKGLGNLLLLKHEGGWMTVYAHCDTLLVKRGEQVKRGQPIATIGETGKVSDPQLHFEIRKGRDAVNPELYLK